MHVITEGNAHRSEEKEEVEEEEEEEERERRRGGNFSFLPSRVLQ